MMVFKTAATAPQLGIPDAVHPVIRATSESEKPRRFDGLGGNMPLA